ncbi:MarR family transcriptional regulator [Methanogenium sp. S4BF]|uniref:MarR family winged helix-turn-helix transcriptional regulator n=1 Tax=Methanogenium sp. S4BF TaxID=1789226 RepID=UPI0024173510|nr:winged helix DNA-binding protein [Methanogenium sp. S4BF]WFN33941.1 MarR family transcriptional regulator [Methanogenium sp. S4BF]
MLNNTPSDTGTTIPDLTEAFIRVLAKAAAVEKEPVDIGHGVHLYTSEVHLIDCVARYPEESISGVATRLGVTKGAISQTAAKLEKKGYIGKYSREGDKKTVLLRLTGRGEEAYAWHRRYHEQMDHILASHLAALTRTDREHLLALLSGLEEMFDTCPAVRESISRIPQKSPADR